MWVFLSSRIRTWLLLAVAVPLVRRVVSGLAGRARADDPTSKRARLLTRADARLAKTDRKNRKK